MANDIQTRAEQLATELRDAWHRAVLPLADAQVTDESAALYRAWQTADTLVRDVGRIAYASQVPRGVR
ncbi:MAG: hypothetical protein NUW01_14850 [Gemmatimonadaceae bacterium]|nr:hypothetical protein [Gemmatimonadaceae bacterium]